MRDPIGGVVNNNLCSGCGLCAGMFDKPAARMNLDGQGFLRPQVLRELNNEEKREFEAVCPGVTVAHDSRDESFHVLWGPLREVLTGHAQDSEIRFNGASGGVISALAAYLLETGQVEGVLHVAVSKENPFENLPQVSTTREEVMRAAGSRYAPAAPLSCLQDVMKKKGRFAFVGKPCDVAALRALSRTRAEVADKFPFMLSFMCAGTPSMKGTEQIVEALGFRADQVIKFRYRGNGWPGMARAETKDGQSAEMEYESSWGRILNKHLQYRCKICPDGTGEFADVACGDAWHGDERGYPTFVESAGRSLVFCRTERGAELVSSSREKEYVSFEPFGASGLEKIQPYQAERKRVLISRLLGAKLALKRVPAYGRFSLFAAAREAGVVKLIKNGVGTWCRLVGVKRPLASSK